MVRSFLLFISVAIFSITVTGCDDSVPQDYYGFKTGTVVKIDGTLLRLVPSTGALFGNDTMKIGATYILSVQCPDGLYVVQVDNIEGGPQTIYTLNSAIKVGTKIKFATKESPGNLEYITPNFSEGKMGIVDSNSIIILQ